MKIVYSAIKTADGDIAFIETELGIPEGAWQGRELTQIVVEDPSSLNLSEKK